MQHRKVLENINLLKKYSHNLIYDYTEYPTKGVWSTEYSDHQYRKDLQDWIATGANSVMLYVHTPFCEELCYFCLCSKSITKEYSKVSDYLYNSLFKEIDLYSKIINDIGKKPKIKEIYFGGGSPTYYNEADFKKLIDKLKDIVEFKEVETFTVEIDPRRVTVEKLLFYSTQGVNRLSFGVQDFDIEVQKEINRIQPPELLDSLLIPEIRKAFPIINFDILVGLPKQTPDSMKKTIERVVKISPDEVQPLYVHYKPGTRSYMTRMTRNVLMPDFYDRKAIYAEVIDGLINGGYIRAGYENFAKPTDRLAQAMEKNTAYYNSLGTTTGEVVDFMSLGASAHGVFKNTYVQNFYEIDKYKDAVQNGKFPIYRGLNLSRDDLIRREVIKRIRVFFEINFDYLMNEFNISFKEYFKKEIDELLEFKNDGLIEISENYIKLTELGKEFTPRIIEVFDTYLNREHFDKNINISQSSMGKVIEIIPN